MKAEKFVPKKKRKEQETRAEKKMCKKDKQ